MQEFLFLLLPVAAGYGYLMGKNSQSHAQQKEAKRLSKHYFRGLNFLFTDQTDKAADTFIKMISLDKDSADIHISMGNFFQHRGELDRAIRIHQNVVQREELTEYQRSLALKSLATDYFLAGFLERAEQSFIGLVDSGFHIPFATKKLFDIYNITKEWDKAVELASRLTPSEQLPVNEIAHLQAHALCELALITDDPKAAEQLVLNAVELFPDLIRGYFVLGDLAFQQSRFAEAFDYWSRIPRIDPEWVSEAIPLLEKTVEQLQNWQEFDLFLEPFWQSCATSYIAKTKLISKFGDLAEAKRVLAGEVKKNPTLRGFKQMLEFYLEEMSEPELIERFQQLRELLDDQIVTKPKYRCFDCGFSSRVLYWNCPACKQWSSIKPLRGLDGQ